MQFLDYGWLFFQSNMRIGKAALNPQKKSIDLIALGSVLALLVFGLIMVYDASAVHALRDFKDSFYYIKQQLIWAGLGLAGLTFFANWDYHNLKRWALPMLALSVLLLLAVFIPGLGSSSGGAQRWLSLGIFSIQPAEIIKLTGVIYLAYLFEKGPKLLPLSILVLFVTLTTAVLQRDLGSASVFILTAGVVYFLSEAPLWHFLISIPAAVMAFAVLIFTSSYRSKRILAFLDPFSDPQGFTYHISQVLIALGSGGILGLGLGQSRQKFEYIPEVTTDSIFAIIGEELGFLGSVFLIFLFSLFIYRGFKIALNCQDKFGRILAGGLISWIAIQAIINLSSMVALMPLTGVPLPFISYGGSALVINLAAVGILLNISKSD